MRESIIFQSSFRAYMGKRWGLLLFTVRYHSIEHLYVFFSSLSTSTSSWLDSHPPKAMHFFFNCFKRITVYSGSSRKQRTMWLVACWAVNKAHVPVNWLISAQQPLGTQAAISCLSKITNHHMSWSVMVTCTGLTLWPLNL